MIEQVLTGAVAGLCPITESSLGDGIRIRRWTPRAAYRSAVARSTPAPRPGVMLISSGPRWAGRS